MLTKVISKLPNSAEFCLVVFVCFWWAIYSSFTSLASYSRSTAELGQERFGGIGAELGEKDHKVIIVQAMPNTPAGKAGLSSGLVIQKIDGRPTEGWSMVECGKVIRGPIGSKVELELVDPTNNRTKTVELTRGGIRANAAAGHVTDHSVLRVVSLELVGLAVTFWIARIRNWPLAGWGFRPSWKSTGAGILLSLITILVMAVILALAYGISPGVAGHRHSFSQLSLPFLVLFVLINPVFEEIIESGYFVQCLQKHGVWIAVFASALFRAFLHAYQGVDAMVLIFPLGLIFGFVYWKWRRLWPLFIAHALFDFNAYFPK